MIGDHLIEPTTYDESCLQEIEPMIINIQQQLLQHQASRILYPDNYKPVDSLDQSLVNEVETLFDAGCDICRHPDVAQMLIYGSPQQSNQALDQLKRMGDACLKAMIGFLKEGPSRRYRYRSYEAYPSFKLSIPGRCQQESNHPICQNILTNNRVIQRRLSLLTAQIQHNPQTVESCLSQETILSDTQSFLNEINDHLLCSEYSIGEEREKVGDFANYIVKKENNNHYKISVPIKFTSIAPSDPHADPHADPHGFSGSDSQEVSEAYDHHIHTHFLNKARQCINQVNPKMLGPRGEKLEIVLEDAYEKKDICTPAHTITITLPNLMMARFDEYPSNIECLTMLHELLHIFGLEDEYAMSFPIFEDTGEDIGVDSEYISVNPSTNNNNLESIQYNSIMAYTLDRWNNVFKSGQDVSLLDPTHFNVILYNNCLTRNDVRLYNDCYNLDIGITLKSQCKRQNLLGRSKQRELEILESEISSNNSLRLKLENFKENSKPKINIQEQVYHQYIERVIERKRAVEAWPDD